MASVTPRRFRARPAAFDPVRYGLSQRLPTLIRGLEARRIAATDRENLVRIETEDGRDCGVFFTLRRAGARRCEMFVVSAYLLERPRQSVVLTGEMRFNVAVGMVLAGKRPKFRRRT